MKTVEEIIKQEPIFLDDWSESKEQGMWADFTNGYSQSGVEYPPLEFNAKILLAQYLYEDYNGSAFVLFAKDSKLYEVNGSHCSCYGLEEQWKPEEVNLEELANRINTHSYSFQGFAQILKDFIGA